MGGADDSGTAAEFLEALERRLEVSGWRTGERTVLDRPRMPEPMPQPMPESVVQRFDRPLDDGWVARLTVSWLPGSELRLLPLRSFVRHYLHLDGDLTKPAAEDLARRCGIDGDVAVPAPPELLPWRGGDDDRRVRGPGDYGPVAGEIAGYAEHALVPWARAHADLDHWLDEWDEPADEAPDPHVDPYADPFADACAVAVMLAAHGRGAEALARIDAARPLAGDDPDLESFVERLTAFAETGVLPDPPPDPPASDPSPVQDPDRYVADRTAEDPIRKEFYAGFNAELGEESVGAQWRYFGRQLRSAARMVRALGGDEPGGLTTWAPVAVGVEVDELLDRMYEAAGPPVDRRVGLQVELGGRGSGPDDGVDVRIGGDTVGVLRSADIPTWGTVTVLDGVRRARLRRKRDRPRFLLEVDIG